MPDQHGNYTVFTGGGSTTFAAEELAIFAPRVAADLASAQNEVMDQVREIGHLAIRVEELEAANEKLRAENNEIYADRFTMKRENEQLGVAIRAAQLREENARRELTEIADMLRGVGIANGSTESMVRALVERSKAQERENDTAHEYLRTAAEARGKAMTQILSLEGVVWKLARQIEEFACGADAFEDYTDSERQLILAMLGNANGAA